MPSHKKKLTKQADESLIRDHIVFIPLLTLTLVFWVLYRSLFDFPIWFDESLGKGVFFGLPVWLYLVITRSESIKETFSLSKLKPGLLLGVAIGGLFGFVTTIIALIQTGQQPQAGALFLADGFWREFALALLTAFWETLLFFSFIMVVIQEKYAKLSFFTQITLVVVIFMAFHLPNIILRFEEFAILSQVFLLSLFALGQALVFASKRNFYTLVISHAIWGMVLLVYGQ